MARYRSIVIIFIAVSICLLGYVYMRFDPAQTVWMPKCPTKMLTHFDCPGCGSQRALHALLHGDLTAAFKANALLVVFLPVMVFLGYVELRKERHPRLYNAACSLPVILSILTAIVLWGVLRNVQF